MSAGGAEGGSPAKTSRGERLTAPMVGGQGRPRGPSPFAEVVPTLWFVGCYVLAIGVWLVAGEFLPGGRVLVVHLFTLGVLTNVVLAFSEHFSRAVTRTPGQRALWWTLAANAGIVLVLIGVASGWLPVLAVGASGLAALVAGSGLHLQRMRRRSIGARFRWVVRLYERAHIAFVYGALLGALLGVGLVTGPWYLGVRLAHLHANVLGWGGLTLLATLVFFGPTMARTRIEAGADERAARALRLGATALAAAVLLLLLLGLPGGWGVAARVAAGVALAAFAWAASVVCLPVLRAVVSARSTAQRPLVLGVLLWLPAVVWADAVLVTAGTWRWLDALGIATLAGVLAPAILATLVYLAPMLRGSTTGQRERIRLRLEVGARTRAVVLNLGVVGAAAGAARLPVDLPLAAWGWTLLGGTVLVTAATALWPLTATRSTTRPATA